MVDFYSTLLFSSTTQYSNAVHQLSSRLSRSRFKSSFMFLLYHPFSGINQSRSTRKGKISTIFPAIDQLSSLVNQSRSRQSHQILIPAVAGHDSFPKEQLKPSAFLMGTWYFVCVCVWVRTNFISAIWSEHETGLEKVLFLFFFFFAEADRIAGFGLDSIVLLGVSSANYTPTSRPCVLVWFP